MSAWPDLTIPVSDPYYANQQHSVRAELRSDVTVIGGKVDARTEAFARACKDIDAQAAVLRELFARYDKAQKDLAGVDIESQKRMPVPMDGAYSSWLSENGGRAEGPGEAPIPVISEDNA